MFMCAFPSPPMGATHRAPPSPTSGPPPLFFTTHPRAPQMKNNAANVGECLYAYLSGADGKPKMNDAIACIKESSP